MPPNPISFEDWFQELKDLNPEKDFDREEVKKENEETK